MEKGRVLVVDDDADRRAFVALKLERHGYCVVEAALAAGAVGYVIKPFDLDEVVASVRAAHHRPVA